MRQNSAFRPAPFIKYDFLINYSHIDVKYM